jgi:hypothetical protein
MHIEDPAKRIEIIAKMQEISEQVALPGSLGLPQDGMRGQMAHRAQLL